MRRLLNPATIVMALAFIVVAPCRAQRQAHTTDEAVRYERDFLGDFFPKIEGAKLWMTVETATPVDSTTPPRDPGVEYRVAIGDGPKFKELFCCIGGYSQAPELPSEHHKPPFADDPFLGPWNPYLHDPSPFVPRPEPPYDIGEGGWTFPHQRLLLRFHFDRNGTLDWFQTAKRNFPWANHYYKDFEIPISSDPEMTDNQIRELYKNLGFNYALGDRNTFEQNLPRKQLEQYLGKIISWRAEFYSGLPDSEDTRIARLKGFSGCLVRIKTENKLGKPTKYQLEFDADGTLTSLIKMESPAPPVTGKS